MDVMDCYTPKGSKVMVTHFTKHNGYSSDEQKVAKYLVVGQPYTVLRTEVGGSHTDVYLCEFPEIRFNSVNFVNVD